MYYLDWDREQEGELGDATDLYHDLHFEDPPASLTRDEFDDLYRKVLTVDTDDLDQLWEEWNRGSGHTAEEFLELRYCERCDTYIEGRDEAITHAGDNHGYDTRRQSDEPDYIRGERSMSVGDVVEIDGTYHIADTVGWDEIDTESGET